MHSSLFLFTLAFCSMECLMIPRLWRINVNWYIKTGCKTLCCGVKAAGSEEEAVSLTLYLYGCCVENYTVVHNHSADEWVWSLEKNESCCRGLRAWIRIDGGCNPKKGRRARSTATSSSRPAWLPVSPSLSPLCCVFVIVALDLFFSNVKGSTFWHFYTGPGLIIT